MGVSRTPALNVFSVRGAADGQAQLTKQRPPKQRSGNRPGTVPLLAASMLLSFTSPAQDRESTCYGTTANGRIDAAVRLPSSGDNFRVYSKTGAMLGRTYVHSAVADVVVRAYANVAQTLPGRVFVLGETGLKQGGRFKPHRTHQNGLSVDFMVPVLDEAGESVPLPTHVLNKFGYDLEFDAEGRHRNLRIDFEAIAEHLYQLDVESERAGTRIQRVIFDPVLQKGLRDSPRWDHLEKRLNFSTKPAWVRHDDHYHVDFAVECQPISAFTGR